MKLIGFSAKNYRSISTAYKLPLADYTVIVGPNNEGKSNILKGLGLALTLLTGSKQQRFRRPGFMSYSNRGIERFDYDWERDYPINLQTIELEGRSEFTCEFELTEAELEEFKAKIKVNLNSVLKAKISIGKSDVKFDFVMKGRGKESLNKKRLEISEFVNEKLLLQYIPAIRTSDLAINIVENLLERELSTLEDNPEFKEVVKVITKLQQPLLKKIAKSLKESISGFIPDVKNISIKNRENVGRLISSSCRVFVDDGIETDLQFKGDGVISLTAISLLQHFSKQGSLNKGLVLLLEEPESHLHPKAIHSLKKVLLEISKTNQVIVTTHSPIIIERLQVKHNVIVENGRAIPANNVNEIRQSLGITMSDNLASAYLVLLVEGEEDIVLLKPWLEEKSSKIKSAFANATLIIDHLGGATNIGYKTSLYKNNLCNVIAYLDNDEAGRKGVSDAENKGILKTNEYVLSFCRGMQNSELEDLIDLNSYRQLIIDEYAVDLNIPAFKTNNKQWSDRVRELFRLNGKIWSDKLEGEIKYKVAKKAASLKLTSLNINKISTIDALVTTIENVLGKQG
ncbi:AAA family ATPase [Chryseobacterium sp. OV279]|uniref:AAA family ATPase n=1 Tax=Chryseobacterium sp. OV279 TaxID=1500285 RepID=UPI000914F6BA|nr:AAA family ATPase [Chryseobacterium sp. OV279]SHE78277.1 Predicted ATP-dependent endonuclease of the OLD family, contains P-loop ATPase and TOPRIM domains [Chryseobacterium sp. OV279]